MASLRPMRVLVKSLIVIVTLALLLATAAATFLYWNLRRSWPTTQGDVVVAGLDGAVVVHRDARGIPDIYADTVADLFFGQGYVTAQDRFYEMDVRRHITSGRLAEMFGEEQVETDAFLRAMGWRRIAEQEMAMLDDASHRILDAYAAGVNAYLADKSPAEVSAEYLALGLLSPDYVIETWDKVDSVAWLKALAYDLNRNSDDEAYRALVAERVGVRRTEQLFPDYPTGRNGVIVSDRELRRQGLPTGSDRAGAARDAGRVALVGGAGLPDGAAAALVRFRRSDESLQELLSPHGPGVGSNSWVVAGQHTVTGMPMLANDPHLGPAMPSVWYQNGLHCNEKTAQCPFDVSGFSMAGMPGVLIGHNDKIAWGLTNMGADVSDLVVEKIRGDSFVIDGRRLPVSERQETIRVAGGAEHTITIRETIHGPIVSDVDVTLAGAGEAAAVQAPEQGESAAPKKSGAEYAVALRWTALEPAPVFDTVHLMNTAANWSQFRAAAERFTVPAQNLVYADVKGNIGYQAPGLVPRRENYDGRWPVPGWDSRFDWGPYIDFDDLPRSLNPEAGFIVTANELVVDPDYPLPVQTDANAYGSRRSRLVTQIRQAIDAGPITMDDMRSMFLDSGNEFAEFLVPEIAEAGITVSGPAAQAITLFDGWDFQQEEDSAPAAYFNVFYTALLARVFDDELGSEIGDGNLATNGGDRIWEALRRLWRDPEDPWWDDVTTEETVETRDDTVRAALEEAAAELEATQGGDPQGWSWGDLHTLTIENSTLGTSGVGVLERILNRGPIRLGGGIGSPLATGWSPAEGYEVAWVPSMRETIDMSDLDNSSWVNLTGSSGHAYHRNYGDQIDAWAGGEQYPWPFGRQVVEAAATDTLRLVPGAAADRPAEPES